MFLGDAAAVGGELPTDGAVGGAGVLAGRVDEVDQRAAALDMAEKAVAEALALVRALDQAGNVGGTKSRSSTRTTPRPGCNVVKG